MSISNTFTINVDFKKSTYMNEPVVTSNDEITFIVNVFDDEQPYDLSSITTFTLASVRPDKQSVLTNGTKTGTNQVTFKLGNTEAQIEGKVLAQAQFYDADGRCSTAPFSYKVLSDPANNYVPSESDKTLIELVLGEAPTILANAEQSIIDMDTLNATVTANESTRQSNESSRKSAETIRGNNESDRILNEIERDGAESSRVSAENTRQNNESVREQDETTRIANETDRENNETIRQQNEIDRQSTFTTTINEVNTKLDELEQFDFVGEYNVATTYHLNNVVQYNGSSYVALKEVTGVTPTDDGINYRLVALKGVDGTGAVSTVNNVAPDSNGNVELTKSNIGLSNVDNTSDLNKPVSTQQQTAINNAVTTANSYTDQQIQLVTETGIPKLVRYEYTIYPTIEGQTSFEIPLDTFDTVTDSEVIIQNQTTLDPNEDYSITGRTVTLTNSVSLNDTRWTLFVYKNVPIGSEGAINASVLANGTIAFEKLDSSTQALINGKASQVDLNTTNTNVSTLQTDLSNLSTDVNNLNTNFTAHLAETAYLVCKATANQSVANNTVTTLFLSNILMSKGTGLTLRNSSEIVIEENGEYEIEAAIEWAVNPNGVRQILLAIEGAVIGNNTAIAIADFGVTHIARTKIVLNAGTVLRLQVTQNSGTAVSVILSGNTPYLAIKRLRKVVL